MDRLENELVINKDLRMNKKGRATKIREMRGKSTTLGNMR